MVWSWLSASLLGASPAEEGVSSQNAILETVKEIGAGQCGMVYGIVGSSQVVKLPKPGKVEVLLNDARMHLRVETAFEDLDSSLRVNISIPTFRAWVGPFCDSEMPSFWTDHQEAFRQHGIEPTYGLVSDRIFPVPLLLREAIVDSLLPESTQRQKKQSLDKTENQDCLVRVYFGRRGLNRKGKTNLTDTVNKLRNFSLHVDEMELLNLDVTAYARIMAEALATMHWKAGVDARDVEFVLGSAPQITVLTGVPLAEEMEKADKDSAARLFRTDFKKRSFGMWLLDFNECSTFTDDEAGQKQLVDAFWWNDPYYPRPCTGNAVDERLWTVFAGRYLEVSRELTDGTSPAAFIEGVQGRGVKRSSEKSLFA